jgi:hypothetical protein
MERGSLIAARAQAQAQAQERQAWLSRRLAPALLTAFALLAGFAGPAHAQAQRSDSGSDAQDARDDALLATPNAATPTPGSNLYATTPGLEEQIASPRFGANLLLPFGWDSNPAELARGGPQSWRTSPAGNVSFSAPMGPTVRFTATGFGEINNFFSTPDVNRDRLGASARLQIVDPNNDQAFSPYFVFAPRWQFAPEASGRQETRQDYNIGFNKRFNLDGSFRPIAAAADTSAATVSSFGLTAFAQKREREPRLSSDAIFLIPSVSCIISQDWNASVAVEFLGRWYERNAAGAANHDFEALPIATIEYVVPADFLGGESVARLLGRPALDLQGSYLKVWSTSPGVSYDQWDLRAVVKTGWRF